MDLRKITNTGTYPARNIVLKGLTNPAEKEDQLRAALVSLVGFDDEEAPATIPGPAPVGNVNLVYALDRALRGTTALKDTGSISADSAYNGAQLTELFNTPADGAFNAVEWAIEGGHWYTNPVVVNKRNRVVGRSTGFLAPGRGFTTLRLNPAAAEPMFTIDSQGSMHCIGIQFWGEGSSDGRHCFYRPAVAAESETRTDLLIENCQIYKFGGDGIRSEKNRKNLTVDGLRSWILNNGGYGIRNIGGEDVVIRNAMIGDNGRTNIYLDGHHSTGGGDFNVSVANMVISGCDVFGGGLETDTGVGSLRDFSNIYIGGLVENSRIIDCENFSPSRYGVVYDDNIFSGDCQHTIIGGRFKTASRFATNTYSYIYTDIGKLDILGSTFVDARRVATTISKHVVEIGPNVQSFDMCKYLGRHVNRTDYPIGDEEFQGSYGTSFTNLPDRIRMIGQEMDGGWKYRTEAKSNSGNAGFHHRQFDGDGNVIYAEREDGAIMFGTDNSINRRIAKGVGMGFGQSWHYGKTTVESWVIPQNTGATTEQTIYTWMRQTATGEVEHVWHTAAPTTDSEINTLGTRVNP